MRSSIDANGTISRPTLRTLFLLTAALLALAVALLFSGPGRSASAAISPAPDLAAGQALFEQRCSTCHSLTLSTSRPRSEAEWAASFDRMMQKGMESNFNERALIVAYLAANFGVTPAPTTTVPAPTTTVPAPTTTVPTPTTTLPIPETPTPTTTFPPIAPPTTTPTILPPSIFPPVLPGPVSDEEDTDEGDEEDDVDGEELDAGESDEEGPEAVKASKKGKNHRHGHNKGSSKGKSKGKSKKGSSKER